MRSFDQALQKLEQAGLKTALVAGGGKMDAVALESGKIDEIYLDIEPFIFGKDIPFLHHLRKI